MIGILAGRRADCSHICDAWVADVRARRAGIWERQTRLAVGKVGKLMVVSGDGDKENAGRKRKIAEPKTPVGKARKALAAAPLQETPYLSPPMSRKRALKKLPVGKAPPAILDEDVLKTPTRRKRARIAQPKVIMESPPATPAVQGGRMIAVVMSSPAKQLRDELRIFEDATRGPAKVVKGGIREKRQDKAAAGVKKTTEAKMNGVFGTVWPLPADPASAGRGPAAGFMPGRPVRGA